MEQEQLKKVAVSDIFINTNFIIPIYQRNYSWKEKEIEQLIEDIDSSIQSPNSSYFLGNLIVNQKESRLYEVVDGQQRLTTLFILQRYLSTIFARDALCFEAREKSNRTLSALDDTGKLDIIDEFFSSEILDGLKIISNYFGKKQLDRNNFKSKLKNVFLIQVQVPQNIDLNHYFEIMNTRGEQLELHEIAKAKILEMLDSTEQRKVGAIIWDNCSNMDSYVQMNFKKEYREKIFTGDWSSLDKKVTSFESIVNLLKIQDNSKEEKSILEILGQEKIVQDKKPSGETEPNEDERFESILSFPNFLLQINSSKNDNLYEMEGNLDDKKFMLNLEWTWKSSINAKSFLFLLLKSRVLFDKYIVKREFARDYKDTGKWSLQRLEKYTDTTKGKSNDKPNYVATFSDRINKQLRTLQSCLRITYTSPKTMHWITLAIQNLLKDENANLTTILENYCSEKIKNSGFENESGFAIERIVFTYLDYLLYRDGNTKYDIKKLSEDWQFQFRNSIEHFYPQNPSELEKWEKPHLDCFGNLALITTSDNSKFSNVTPLAKVDTYKSIIDQSLKLMIMAKMVKDNHSWTKEMVELHKDEMFEILAGN
ncbi:DUF262 domain-containing protein [Leptospira bouyouniensis]|uniref:DUF262 domain-containing protein n=1 Tax=Leptospira bouyouniensis TaxID=2484911 RepID=A0A7I0IPL4_9LEPT|nr:DUF262 domain-containing protein [Leptospira bouyouniensis]TGL06709.1 DUF262 domain-containing protein [Leptospira bouyouniensis]